MARLVSMLFAAVFVLGCDSDARYYCVAEGPPASVGCFLCRGLQCSRQDPPERPSCLADAECGAGAWCTNQGCVDLCTADEDCPLGTQCTEDGLCLNPSETDVTPVPDPDRPEPGDPGDLSDPGDPGDPGNPGEPSEPEGFCPHTPCKQGRLCLDGECRTPCETDEDCAMVDASIRFCRSVAGQRLCVRSSEALSRCQLAIDCAFGERCEEGNCVSAASATSDP